jgi:hypothetical protein
MQINNKEQAAEIIEVWNELYHGEPRESDKEYSELQLEFMELILETLKEMDKKDHRKEQKRTRNWKPIKKKIKPVEWLKQKYVGHGCACHRTKEDFLLTNHVTTRKYSPAESVGDRMFVSTASAGTALPYISLELKFLEEY